MSNCKIVKERLIEFIEGDVSESLAKAIRKHLDECDQCRGLYAGFKAVYSSADEIEQITLSPTFHSRLQTRIEKYEDERVSLTEIRQYFTSKARPVFASIAFIAAIFMGHLMGHGTFTSASAKTYTDEEYLAQYYGLDQFELSTELGLQEFYYELLNEGDGNE